MARTKQTNTTSFNDALVEATSCLVPVYVSIQEFAVRDTLCLSMTGEEMRLRAALAVIISDWIPMSITHTNVSVGDVQGWIEQLLKFETSRSNEKLTGLITYYWPNVTF